MGLGIILFQRDAYDGTRRVRQRFSNSRFCLLEYALVLRITFRLAILLGPIGLCFDGELM